MHFLSHIFFNCINLAYLGFLTFWIDTCQGSENLLAAAGQESSIKIFDRRESKLVKTFENFHTGMN